jgi:hypothetical protein
LSAVMTIISCFRFASTRKIIPLNAGSMATGSGAGRRGSSVSIDLPSYHFCGEAAAGTGWWLQSGSGCPICRSWGGSRPRTPKACWDKKPQFVHAVTTEGTVGPREKAIAPEADERSPETGWLKNPSTRVNCGLPQRGQGRFTRLAFSASTTCLACSGVILPLRSTYIGFPCL